MAALKKSKPKKLSPREKRVVDAYFANGFKKMAAMRSAGYAPSSVHQSTGAFWRRIHIQDEVKRRMDAEHEASIATENEILAVLSQNLRAGQILAKFKVVQPDGSLSWDFKDATPEELAVISELSTETYMEGKGDAAREVKRFKVKHADVTTSAQLLMRSKGMLKDKLEVGAAEDLVTLLQQRGRQASPEKAK